MFGPTPVVEFSVSRGRHTIRVERAGYKTRSETVDVPPNGPVRKNWCSIRKDDLMRVRLLLVLGLGLARRCAPAQTVQNATLRKAQQAFDNLEFRPALSGAQAALRERLTGFRAARPTSCSASPTAAWIRFCVRSTRSSR